jgi:hypothetical protein
MMLLLFANFLITSCLVCLSRLTPVQQGLHQVPGHWAGQVCGTALCPQLVGLVYGSMTALGKHWHHASLLCSGNPKVQRYICDNFVMSDVEFVHL